MYIFLFLICTFVGLPTSLIAAKKQTQGVVLQPAARPTKKERRQERKQEARKRKQTEITHSFKEMTFQELTITKDKLLKEGNKQAAVKFLERMKTTCDDLAELRAVTLEYADILYDTRDFSTAGTIYQEFTKLYPGSERVEYAHYKAILCSFEQIQDAERDQTKTRETLDLTTTFLDKAALFVVYAPQVIDIANKCRQRLLENEISIANFYLNRGSTLSAQKRIEGMRTTFATALPSSESSILSLEIDLATKVNNPVLAETKRKELAQKFPDVYTTLTAPKPVRLAHRF